MRASGAPNFSNSQARNTTRALLALLALVCAIVPGCGNPGDDSEGDLGEVEQALDPNTPPPLPAPLDLPAQPIVPGAAVGYLPGNWNVTPTGRFTYSIPIDVPPGRAGMEPRLSLEYS